MTAPEPVQLHSRDTAPRPGDTRPGTDGRWQNAVSSVSSTVSSRRGGLAAVPIVLVNTVATGAQLGFWRAHLPALTEAVLVAVALESIAIYLAWQAHLAQLADDSALRLRLAAYSFALVIGTLNYSHFMLPGWRPTVAAVTFGLMSAVSPWLWSVHSRRVSRDALKARGDIEPHAVRLGGTRWLWHPYRSLRVMSWATWTGQTVAAKAVTAVYPDLEDDTADSRDDTGSDSDDKPILGRDRAAAIIRDNPGLDDAEIAAQAQVSLRTVQRARAWKDNQ